MGDLRSFPGLPCHHGLSFLPAWMFGDPHITTLDGANFTFNGLGDFQLVRAWDGNSSFLLQGRTAQTGSAQATNFIAFAAKYDTNSLSPIIVSAAGAPRRTGRRKKGTGQQGGRTHLASVVVRESTLERFGSGLHQPRDPEEMTELPVPQFSYSEMRIIILPTSQGRCEI